MQFTLIDQFGNAFVVGGETKVEELTINGYKLVVNGVFKPEEEAALHLPIQQELPLQ